MNKVEFARTAKVPFAKRYDNYIGGRWVAPKSGRYFDNLSPVNGRLAVRGGALRRRRHRGSARRRAQGQGRLGQAPRRPRAR